MNEISVDVTVMRKTDKAVLVLDENDEETWLPISQVRIDYYEDDDGRAELVLPEWLAREKGWC